MALPPRLWHCVALPQCHRDCGTAIMPQRFWHFGTATMSQRLWHCGTAIMPPRLWYCSCATMPQRLWHCVALPQGLGCCAMVALWHCQAVSLPLCYRDNGTATMPPRLWHCGIESSLPLLRAPLFCVDIPLNLCNDTSQRCCLVLILRSHHLVMNSSQLFIPRLLSV